MMRVRQVFEAATTTLGGQAAIVLDDAKVPFLVSAHIDIVSGSAEFDVEYSTDDLAGPNAPFPPDVRWASIGGGAATALVGLNVPISAVRLNLKTLTGEVRFTVIQGTKS
jgi:hypothetical protein